MPKKNFLENREEFFLREKKKRRRSKLLIFIMVCFCFLVSAGVGFYFLMNSDLLSVKSFEIRGVELSDAARIRESVISKMEEQGKWRSLVGAENIVFWAFGRKPDFEEKSIPFLASLNIQTDFVSRKLQITVKERESIAVWCSRGKECYNFDKGGVIFAEAPELQGVLILKFIDENERVLNFGDAIFQNRQWLENILAVADIIRNNGLPILVVIIKDFSLQEWSAEVYPELNFYFSLNFVPDNFGEIIKNLKQKLEFGELTYLDFRVPNRIYYK